MIHYLKHFLLAISLVVIAFLNSSCDSSYDSVEYWKPTLLQKYGYPQNNEIIDSYLENRFNSMVSDPNEFQLAYLQIAKDIAHNMNKKGRESVPVIVRKYIDSFVLSPYSKDKEYAKNEYIMANIKSHPELYAENVSKIIGSIDDLREEMAKHVKVEKVVSEDVSGFKRHNVLYNIADVHYAICCVTEKGNGRSEIQFVEHSKSINDILDYWQAIMEY